MSKDLSDSPLALTAALLRKGRSAGELAATSRTIHHSLSVHYRDAFDQLRILRTRLAELSLIRPGHSAASTQQHQHEEIAAQADALETSLTRHAASRRARKELLAPTETVERIADSLPRNGALVELIAYQDKPFIAPVGTPPEHVLGAPRYLALILFADGRTGAVDLGPAAPVDLAIQQLRGALTKRTTTYQPAAEKLYQLAFRPLMSVLGETRQVFLSPDGHLSVVPFDALHDGKQFLADRFDFTYLNSGKDLLPFPEDIPPSQPVVVLADPDFGTGSTAPSNSLEQLSSKLGERIGSQSWAPLPGTRLEAEAIQRLLPQAELLLGRAATKDALLQMRAPGILHIATHGFFLEDTATYRDVRGSFVDAGDMASLIPPEDPLLRSGLVLAGTQALVTALELSGMDLWGTQLVVLSACDTGRGEVKPGQGVYGLRRALGVAGAETVVMSLWKVNDETTRQLMEDYYRHLLAGQGRAQALRESMRALRQQHPHPYYWASFIAVGQDTPLRGLTLQALAQP